MTEPYKFEVPSRARTRRIEWPAGSGRSALYTPDELHLVAPLIAGHAKTEHAADCRREQMPSLAGDPPSDPTCPKCRYEGEFSIFHRLKVDIGLNIVTGEPADPDETEFDQPTLFEQGEPAPDPLVMHEALFDREAAAAGAADGMENANRAARVQAWKKLAGAWLDTQTAGSEFTADDLTASIGLPDLPGEVARANNVVGAWIGSQSKAGKIVWTQRFATSARPEGHGNQQRVWTVP